MDPYITQASPDMEPSTGPGLIVQKEPDIQEHAPTQIEQQSSEQRANINKRFLHSASWVFGVVGIVAIAFPVVVGTLPDRSGVNGWAALVYGIFCWPIGVVSLILFAVFSARQRRYSNSTNTRGRIVSTVLITTAIFIVAVILLEISTFFTG